MSTIASLMVAIGVDPSGVDRGLAQAESKFSTAGRRMTRSGTALTAGVTLPLLGVATAGLSMAADFDKTMRLVSIATNGPTGALKDLAMQMGQDTAFSAAEAADAMLDLAKGGMTSAQIQGGALAATMKLASAGGVDLASSAVYVSNAMAAFGLKAKDANKVTVALAGAANASSASVESLGMGLAQSALSARNAGLSLQETTGVLSMFDAAGLKGSDAGTSLKSMLNSLTPATDKAKNAMSDLGLDFVKADGSFVSVANVAAQLHSKLGDLTEAQRAQALETIFGSDGMRAASVLMNEGAKGVEKYTKASKDGRTTTKLANAAMQGLSGAVERAKGSLETAALVIGTVLAPYAEKAAGFIELGANAFSKLPAPIQGVVVGVAALVAVIGPLLIGFGFLATAIGAISLPVVAVVAGIALLVAAFVLAYQRSETFRAGVQGALAGVVQFVQTTVLPGISRIGSAFMELVAVVTPIVMQILGVIRDNWPQIVAVAEQVWSTVKSAVTGALTLIRTEITVVTAVVKAIWNTFGQTIVETVQRMWPAAVQIVKGALNIIQGVIRTVTALIKGDWSGVWNGIKQILSGVWDVIQGVVKSAVGIVLGIVKGFGDVLHAAWKGIWSAAKDAVGNAWDGIRDAVSKGIKKVLGLVRAMPTSVVSALISLVDRLFELGTNILQGLWDGIKSKAGDLLDYVGGLASDIAGAIANPLSILSPSRVTRYQGQMVALGLQLGIADGKAKVLAAARDISESAAQKLIDAAKVKANAVHAIGKLLGSEFAKGVDGSRASVLEKFGTLLEQIKVLHVHQLSTLVQMNRRSLGELGDEWDKAHARLTRAKDKLKALVDEAANYAGQVQSSIAGTGNVTNFTGQLDENGQAIAVTFADIEAGMVSAAQQATDFSRTLAALVRMGLNKDSLADLVAKGPAEGLASAQAILAGGEAAVTRVNQLHKQISTLGVQVAKLARDSMYDAGIQSAQGLVDGLANAEDAIAKQMRRIARVMIRELRQELGIHSPSTVLAELGTYSGAGLVKGMDGMQSKIAAAAARMSTASVPEQAYASDYAYAGARMPTASGPASSATGGSDAALLAVLLEILEILREGRDDDELLRTLIEGLPRKYQTLMRQEVGG